MGPCLVLRALAAAPVPRPPQPTSATRMVLSAAACTAGTVTPARAEAVATVPVALRKSRRDAPSFEPVRRSAPWRDRAQSAGGSSSEQIAVFVSEAGPAARSPATAVAHDRPARGALASEQAE